MRALCWLYNILKVDDEIKKNATGYCIYRGYMSKAYTCSKFIIRFYKQKAHNTFNALTETNIAAARPTYRYAPTIRRYSLRFYSI